MTARERVLGALKRKKIDRIPLSLECGGPNSAHDALLKHFGLEDHEALLQAMDIDFRWVGPLYVGPKGRDLVGSSTGEDTLFGGTEYMSIDFDASGGIAGTYADGFGHRPFRDFTSVGQIEEYPWPSVEWFDFSSLAADCRRHERYCVRSGGWAPLVSRVFELFGMERGLTHFYDRPDLIHATIERVTDFYYAFYDATLTAAEGGIQIFGLGDDFATQQDLLISPELWREFCKKPLERLFSLGRKHGVYVFFHSCGAISSIIDDLIEIGLDILFPVQPNALGMEARTLKDRYGGRLAFFGGIDVQRVLPFGSVEEVRAHVHEQIDVLGAGGGYILSSAHNLLKEFPLANILAMYDEAAKTPLD